jgi:hypothetical protein
VIPGRSSWTVAIAAVCGLLLLALGFSGVPSRFWGTSARTQAELSGIQAAASESQSSTDVVQVTRSDRPTVESRYASSSLPLRREGVYLGVSIRKLPVATWILADNPETRGNLGFDYSRIDPRDLRVLRLKMVKPDGGQLLIDRLEFVENLDESQVQVGSTFYLSYPELDVTGDAEVLAITPCPPIPARPSPRHCLVTSKFTHDAAEVLDLSIEGVAGPIGVTPNHPIWSDDRREFVRADDLAVGESLLDAQGARVAVREITARSGRTEVFNLEVDGEHVYHVSSAGVLVHNECPKGVAGSSGRPLSPSSYPNPDPHMSAPPVRYEPQTIEEVVRMRQGKGPTTRATHGTGNIEAHHRQQIPIEKGGVMDELEMGTHRGPGNHTRHSQPTQLTPSQRRKEINKHYKQRGGEYILPGGEGI